ncbi:hypothetical protein [Actinokineospora globicatena]|uniref:hypothetical protein n=1 Tax=Actinokineospora globicatena TaxID=103729 RepID=UPI0020A52A3F|nr:hypothetical protein [Actinokineospora globicatena]MCP2305679.1 hypothetical protein [Actinokineospora globicatena]GLW81549.1 hypothetical protein Aglo01_60300 [Actinokineospora globicatena]GLW87753.1 hypothetical protein Aglo02_53920 [Actinokineospora globicatena]
MALFTQPGVSVEAWVDLAHDVPITLDSVEGGQATLQFGQSGEYTMTMSQANLTQFVELATRALTEMAAS